MKALYIGVNYNSAEYAVKWAQSIRRCSPNSDIIVVDNSKEKSVLLVQEIGEYGEKAKYIKTPSNLGYINAAAYALSAVDRQKYDWVVVSNVDVELVTTYVEDVLVSVDTQLTGIVAPSIIDKNSQYDRNPYLINYMDNSSIIRRINIYNNGLLYYTYSCLSRTKEKLRIKHIASSKEEKVIYAPYGAVMYFSRTYFEHGNDLYYPTFLYGEELFAADDCLRCGLKVLYKPAIMFVNIGHVSVSKLNRSRNRKLAKEALEQVLRTRNEAQSDSGK